MYQIEFALFSDAIAAEISWMTRKHNALKMVVKR